MAFRNIFVFVILLVLFQTGCCCNQSMLQPITVTKLATLLINGEAEVEYEVTGELKEYDKGNSVPNLPDQYKKCQLYTLEDKEQNMLHNLVFAGNKDDIKQWLSKEVSAHKEVSVRLAVGVFNESRYYLINMVTER